ncbi:hypothetical protein BU16DRAFT_320051 [Lophium mytilinum]|uniref:Uncharacterized protein n=1 Tax=Lophium mytilinum TaxID=390894 RepID=A0A6A6R2J9_9PEZI|nr:hypothetical protein BU16DRAFT_320051 [Lophium mytilinum]
MSRSMEREDDSTLANTSLGYLPGVEVIPDRPPFAQAEDYTTPTPQCTTAALSTQAAPPAGQFPDTPSSAQSGWHHDDPPQRFRPHSQRPSAHFGGTIGRKRAINSRCRTAMQRRQGGCWLRTRNSRGRSWITLYHGPEYQEC